MVLSTSRTHSSGFTLIEIVLALALTALVVAAVTNGLLLTDRTLRDLAGSVKARTMTEECVSVLRWMRDARGVASVSEGPYGLVAEDGAWQLTDAPDIDGDHERTVTISREGERLLRATCEVRWETAGQPASMSVMTLLGT